MRKTEETKVLGVITLTLVLLLAFCLSTSDILALLLLGIIGIILAMAFARQVKNVPVYRKTYFIIMPGIRIS